MLHNPRFTHRLARSWGRAARRLALTGKAPGERSALPPEMLEPYIRSYARSAAGQAALLRKEPFLRGDN
jgi:hypothetical protein